MHERVLCSGKGVGCGGQEGVGGGGRLRDRELFRVW